MTISRKSKGSIWPVLELKAVWSHRITGGTQGDEVRSCHSSLSCSFSRACVCGGALMGDGGWGGRRLFLGQFNLNTLQTYPQRDIGQEVFDFPTVIFMVLSLSCALPQTLSLHQQILATAIKVLHIISREIHEPWYTMDIPGRAGA